MCTCSVCIDYIIGYHYGFDDPDYFEDPEILRRQHFEEFADREVFENDDDGVKEGRFRADPPKPPLSEVKAMKKYNRAVKAIRRKSRISNKKANRRMETDK